MLYRLLNALRLIVVQNYRLEEILDSTLDSDHDPLDAEGSHLLDIGTQVNSCWRVLALLDVIASR